jgi:hypothetical protein
MKNNWMGRDTLHEDHTKDLETTAAHHEFSGKMSREEAEGKAYDDYKRKHHVEGAAHHLHGLRGAAANGEREDGQKHAALYKMHLKAAGFNPHDTPPPEVVDKVSDKEWAKFSNHPSDDLLGKK